MRLIGLMLLVVAMGFSARGQDVEPIDQGAIDAQRHANSFGSSAKFLPDKTARGGMAELGFTLETRTGVGISEDRLNRTGYAIILKLDEFGLFAYRDVVVIGKAKFKRGRNEKTEFRYVYEDSPGTYKAVYALASARDIAEGVTLSAKDDYGTPFPTYGGQALLGDVFTIHPPASKR